jgi:hypothetical protein
LQAKAAESFGNLGGELTKLFYHEEHEDARSFEQGRHERQDDRIYMIRRCFPRQFRPARHPVHPVHPVKTPFLPSCIFVLFVVKIGFRQFWLRRLFILPRVGEHFGLGHLSALCQNIHITQKPVKLT